MLLDRLERRIDPFAPFDEGATPPRTVGRFILHYLAPVRGTLAVLFVLALAVGIVEASLYPLMGWFVDLLARSTPERVLAEHGGALLAVALMILLLRPLLVWGQEVVSNQVLVPQTTNQIRWRTHLYTLGHALEYFQADFAGRLANRVTQVGPAVREVAVTLIESLLYVAVFAITAMGVFSTISVWLALPVLAWAIAYGALTAWFVPRAQARSLKVADARSGLIGRIVDSYTNILTVKLFARAGEERSAVRGAIEAHTAAYLHSFRLITAVAAAKATLNSLLIVSVAATGFALWRQGAMTSGEGAAGMALVLRLVAMSGWVMQTVRGLFDDLGVIQESMDTISRPHALLDRPGATDLVVAGGAVAFEHVSFHYGRQVDGGDDGVIEDLSFTIRPGERVGLVGPSGAGKSTIAALLLRLHDLEGGRITVDGQDVAAVTQDSLRRQVAMVTQDTSLLHRSIRENIAYGRPDATDAEVERAARLARADDFIAALEDKKGRRGYAARAGERGVKLSGGQRQRIAIARVILKDAPILILDEATSALDSEAEAAIQESLEGLMEGRTVIAIAHRLSTIAALDRLIVLDGGRIVETGTHAELIRREGVYARLWRRQSGGFLGEETPNRVAAPV